MLDHLTRLAARFGVFLTARTCPVCGVSFFRRGAILVRPYGEAPGKPRPTFRPVCCRPACNSIGGFMEAHDMLTTDPEGRLLANELQRLYRDLVDANTRGEP